MARTSVVRDARNAACSASLYLFAITTLAAVLSSTSGGAAEPARDYHDVAPLHRAGDLCCDDGTVIGQHGDPRRLQADRSEPSRYAPRIDLAAAPLDDLAPDDQYLRPDRHDIRETSQESPTARISIMSAIRE